MNRVVICAVAAAALAMCASAMAGSVIQPVAMTNSFEWPSLVDPNGGSRVADDWKCTDGQPIVAVKWWGNYHPYADGMPGVVAPPGFQPTAFILRQYADNNGQPGTLLKTVEVPRAQCRQTHVGMAAIEGGFSRHVFSYQATLAQPWTQTKGSVYWLSVQAKYSRPIEWDLDGYAHWGWMSTPPGDFLGTGHDSADGITWNPIWIDDPSEKNNFAFEIGTMPVGLAANKPTFRQSDSISVTADVAATATPCWPFVRIVQPNKSVLYLTQASGFVPSVAPYLGIEAGPIALPKIDDYSILPNARFENMPKGTYRLEGGAVDPVTTDINDLQYIGIVDSTPLVIE